MNVGITENIIAIVTLDETKILSCGVPVFLVDDQKEQEKVSLLLAKTVSGMVHDLENGCYIIVRH